MAVTVKKNLTWNLIAQAWQLLLFVIVIPVYTRTMQMEAFGLVGLYMTIQALMSQFDLGMSMTLNRELARCSVDTSAAEQSQDLVRTFEVVYWGMALVIGALIAGASGQIAESWVKATLMPMRDVKWAVALIGLAIALQWPLALYSGGLMGLQRQVLLAGINIVMYTIRFAGVVPILLWVSPTIHAFFIWQSVTGFIHVLVTAIALWMLLPEKSGRAHFKMSLLRQVWRFASHVWLIAIISVALTQSDKVILSKWLTLEAFGYYSLAALAAATFGRLFQSVFNAVYPRFAQLAASDDKTELRLLYHRACQAISVPTLALAGTVILFPKAVLFAWTNSPVTADRAATVLVILAAASAIHGVTHVPFALQYGHGWTTLALRLNLAILVLFMPALLWLAWHYGGSGAASAWLGVTVVYILVLPHMTHQRLLPGASWHYYVWDTLAPLLASACVLLPARFLMPELGRWATLAYLGCTGLTALVLAAFAAPEMRGIILEFLRKHTGADKCASA